MTNKPTSNDVISSPQGELVIQTVAMPNSTNFNGDIFGGWLLSQMDMGAGIVATRRCQKRCATVAIDKIEFLSPVKVGDTVCCYGKLINVGRTSMKIQIQAWVIRKLTNQRKKVTDGLFTFVAINEDGNPVPVDDK